MTLKRFLKRPAVRIGGVVAVLGGGLGAVANFSALMDLVSPDETREIVADAAVTLSATDAKVNELLNLMRTQAALKGAGLDPQSERTIKLALEAILTSGDVRKADARAALDEGRMSDAADAIALIAEDQEDAAGVTSRAAAETWREVAVLRDFEAPDEALEALERAQALDPGHVGGRLHRARIQFRLGVLDAAAADALSVRRSGEATSEEQARASSILGRIARSRGEYDDAQRHFAEGLETIGVGAPSVLRVSLMVDLSTIDRVRGAEEEAEARLARALTVSRDAGDATSEALVLNSLAVLAQRRGDFDRAEELLKAAHDIYRAEGDLLDEALIAGNRGALAILREKFDDAERLLLRSVEIGERLRLKDSLAHDYNNLGDLALRRGDLDGADTRLSRAAALADELKMDSLRPYISITMGEVASARGDQDRACRLLVGARDDLIALDDANHSVASQMIDEAGCG